MATHTITDRRGVVPNFVISEEGGMKWLVHQPTGNRVPLAGGELDGELLRTKMRYLKRQISTRRAK